MSYRALLALIAFLVLATPPTAFGQATTFWAPPKLPIKITFKAGSGGTAMALVDDGLAMEAPAELLMIKHRSVAIEAALPEAGEFQVEQSNPQARVEVKNVRVEGKTGRAEVVAKFEIMDRNRAKQLAKERFNRYWNPARKEVSQEAQKLSVDEMAKALRDRGVRLPPVKEEERDQQVRQRYIDMIAQDRITEPLRAELQKISDQKPLWLPPGKRAQWGGDTRAVLDNYEIVMQWQVIDEYLQEIGLGIESNVMDYQTRLEKRLTAVYLILSGKFGEAAVEVAQNKRDKDSFRRDREIVDEILGPQGFRKVREMVEVKLRCHFLTKADPQDANAQWFNGQRIACQAPGVALIRVLGHLDPGRHDRVDWWILEGYAAGTPIQVDKPNEVAVGTPFPGPDGARLRVAAKGDKPVDYTLEFRGPSGSANREVVIYESPSAVDAEFPF